MTKIIIQIPAIIEKIFVFLLLRLRKMRFGLAFRKIRLTQNQFAIVDPDDFERLNACKWHATHSYNNTFYAVRHAGRTHGKRTFVLMHRFIMNAPPNCFVDHKDGTGLNNTKQNLRLATPLQNNRNCKKQLKKTTSKYKGVCYDKQRKKFRADIKLPGKRKFLGHFLNEIDAARAYDAAAKKYYGSFARPNLPQTDATKKYQNLYCQILASPSEQLIDRISGFFENN
ncbi:MAG: hypothetical protein JW806_01250 [Sedimentisphaerales bacterium]|nr:hypothetical protein [Sedimentisphaerales bacterium]